MRGRALAILLLGCSNTTHFIAAEDASTDVTTDAHRDVDPVFDAGDDVEPTPDAGPMLGRQCDIDTGFCDLPKMEWLCWKRHSPQANDMFARCTFLCDKVESGPAGPVFVTDPTKVSQCESLSGKCLIPEANYRMICVPK